MNEKEKSLAQAIEPPELENLTVEVMKLQDIVIKSEYFSRVALNEDTVARYRELYKLGERLPPLRVQKEKHILIDGHHRYPALLGLGREDVEVKFLDIPENEIYFVAIDLNRRHGLPYSREDRDKQILKLRFERDPPLTYEEIGRAVGISTSRVGEVCRELELNINGTINTKPDLRRSITPEQEKEIEEQSEKGEPTSEIAKDFHVSKSRVSQLKKRKTKPWTLSKMSRSLLLKSLKKRFRANNPEKDEQEIDWDAYFTPEDFDDYSGLLEEYVKAYPNFNWYYPREIQSDDVYYDLRNMPEEINENSVKIKLKLYWVNKKYAQIKGTIPQKILKYVRDRLHGNFTIEWPLEEAPPPDGLELLDGPVFPKLSDEELVEIDEMLHPQFPEPEYKEPEPEYEEPPEYEQQMEQKIGEIVVNN